MKTKQLLSFVLIALLIGQSVFSFNTKNDPEKDKVLISVINYMLTRGHYVEKQMDDAFSVLVYNNFIDGMDPSKRYFTQEDIKEFSQYKYQVDNQLRNSDLTFYNLVHGRFLDKLKASKAVYSEILKEPFNFRRKESVDINFEKVPFATNANELADYWRKQLKLQTLSRIQEKQELQEEKFKKDKNFAKKSFAELEKIAREEVLENMNELYLRIEELEHQDWFSTFLNSVVAGFDPHTSYLSPRSKEKFDQDMSGKLEGIGARLQPKGIYTSVVELVSGGPAWKQGELEPGDIILKVAQGENEPLDIVGMRLDDAIKFIKGKKGTEVRLTVKKKIDGSIKIISIIRDVVELEETFVKSTVVEKDGKLYGLINLPGFYIDFDDSDRRDSAKDMKKEIERLKQQGVEGLLIDLRNNGGGSLKTAVEISGLFIDQGPVVQIKYRGEKPIVRKDLDAGVSWDGALVVLVNEFSASASEIFAGAMQDYNRAVIMGGEQTFGKGTVQQVLPINQFFPNYKKDLGFLKMTIQQFYRVSGGSTQIEGVYSDIAMPTRLSYMKYGERDMKGALAWDKVPMARYTQTNTYSNLSDVINNSKMRIADSRNFQLVNEYAKWLKQQQDDTDYSLNYNTYVKETKEKESYAKRFSSVFKYNSNLTFESPKYELELLKKDEDLREKRNRWHKNLSKDMYVAEALNVLSKLELRKPVQLVKN